LKALQATARAGLITSLLFCASTITLASQTYVLRSRSPRPIAEDRFRQPAERALAQPRVTDTWVINNQYAIDDPDDPDGSATPGSRATSANAQKPRSNRAVQIARMYRGTRYVWGGTTSRGFDCSGFVRYVYARLGQLLPRTAREQSHCGQVVHSADLKPGDILFFHTSRRGISHVGIYLGSSRFIHAANPRKGVTVSVLGGYYAHRLVGARRLP
jgi:cell wall-associated NlpC family hydrolase